MSKLMSLYVKSRKDFLKAYKLPLKVAIMNYKPTRFNGFEKTEWKTNPIWT